jgi:hypothetical protein
MLIYAYRQSDMCYTGTVEVPDGTTAIPPFHDFTAPPEQDGFHAVMTWQGWTLVEGETPPDPQPQIDLQNWRNTAACTPFQGRMALSDAGLLTQAQALVDAGDEKTKTAWEYALEWRRVSPMIAQLGAALNLTDVQIDDLFKEAQSITV